METKYRVECQTHSVEDTTQLGKQLGAFLQERQEPLCVALIGDLGTGKTHMSQGIGLGFGIKEEMTSPTFALMNTYEAHGQALYHFDVYRLDDVCELENIGFYEYTEDQISIVEWANKFPHELPDETLWVTITRLGESERQIMMASDILSDVELAQIGGQYVVRN